MMITKEYLKTIDLEYRDYPESAYMAYCQAAKKYHDKYARVI